MKISVIIPNYNDLRVERALRSVFAQTYKNLEVIVVDALSTKEELESIYETFPISKLIKEKDGGIFDALNKGIRNATGDSIYLMGSDDFLPFSDTLEKAAGRLTATGADGVSLGCEFINSNGQVIRTWYPKKVSASRIKNGIFPPHFSLLLKKELYDLVGEFKFRQTKNVACDIFWLLDLAIKKPDLHIEVISDRFLVMEYGGASTGSLKTVWKQFKVVFSYSKGVGVSTWPYMSIIRTASKLAQFRVTKNRYHNI